MIAHLCRRDNALESFGWKGRPAEWIALVCLHSGVFTRTQGSSGRGESCAAGPSFPARPNPTPG